MLAPPHPAGRRPTSRERSDPQHRIEGKLHWLVLAGSLRLALYYFSTQNHCQNLKAFLWNRYTRTHMAIAALTKTGTLELQQISLHNLRLHLQQPWQVPLAINPPTTKELPPLTRQVWDRMRRQLRRIRHPDCSACQEPRQLKKGRDMAYIATLLAVYRTAPSGWPLGEQSTLRRPAPSAYRSADILSVA